MTGSEIDNKIQEYFTFLEVKNGVSVFHFNFQSAIFNDPAMKEVIFRQQEPEEEWTFSYEEIDEFFNHMHLYLTLGA